MKKLLIFTVVGALMASGVALASGIEGKISEIDGGKVTVTLDKSDAQKLTVGDKVELEVKSKAKKSEKAPAAGNDMLMGC